MNVLSRMAPVLLPRTCPVCHRRLEHTEDSICPLCASVLPRMLLGGTSDNAMLRTLWSQVPLEHAFTLLAYRHTSAFRNLLERIKYQGDADLALRLGRWVGQEAARVGLSTQVDILVPVPLAPERERERGYNQAFLLAQGMAEVMGLSVECLLTRTYQRGSQTRLTALGRAHNAQALYHASVPRAICGHRVALVDDVMTTGSTLKQCAEALLAADPTMRVSLLTLAFAGG